MQRTRNPLGEIGNRVAQQPKNCGNGKPPLGKTKTIVIDRKVTSSAVEMSKPVMKSVSFATSKTAASVLSRPAAVQRNNSTLGTAANSQAFSALKGLVSNSQNARVKLQPNSRLGVTNVKTKQQQSTSNSNAVEIPRLQSTAVESTSNWQVVEAKPLPFEIQHDKTIAELTEAFSLQRFDIPDIDAADTGVSTAKDYVKEISMYMFQLEKKFPVSDKYLNGRLINGRMRSVLMDWLVEVHGQFKYSAETLFMTAKTMDRYLQLDQTVVRTQLQLVGMAALLLSAKFEEVMTPNIQDFSAVSDNAFSVAELRRMEEKMLKRLGFDLSAPQPVFFLRRFAKAAQAQFKLYQLAKYIMELTMIDYEVVHLYPSQAAAGSLALAIILLDKKSATAAWTATLEHYSGYSLEELKPVLKLLVGVLTRTYEVSNKLQAVTSKYARGRVLRVSQIPEVQDVKSWKAILQELA